MNLVVKLGLVGVVAASWLGLVACSSNSEAGSPSSGATGSSSSSGAGGQGGNPNVTTSSSSSGGGGAPFIDCPESPANFSMGDCDLLNPDCPPGKACFPVIPFGETKMTTQCITWSGVKGPGAACTANEECAAGLICAIYCSPPCCHTAGFTTCDCSISSANFGDPKATVWACNYLPICELFVADTCSKHPGTQCHLQDINQDLATCAPPSVGQMPPMEGQTCKFINDCEQNQMCQGTVCRYNCLVDSYMSKAIGEGGCPVGQVCKTLVAGKNTGVCQP